MHAVQTFEITLALLGVVVALQWGAQRLRLPPTTALLVGGGGLAFVPGLPPIGLDPDFALVFFLPPLLMDGAYYTALGRFRRHLSGILSLAVGAVVFTTMAVGIVAHWLVPQLPWSACFALGAILSPPVFLSCWFGAVRACSGSSSSSWLSSRSATCRSCLPRRARLRERSASMVSPRR